MRQKRVFFVLGFAALMVAIPVLLKFGNIVATSATDSLVGYWKFDETLSTGSRADSSGDSNSGSLTGTVVPQPDASVPTTNYPNARSLDFSAINSVVTVNAASNINDLNHLSIGGWINPDNYGPSDLGRIFEKSTGAGGDGWTVYFDGGRLAFYSKFTTSALTKVSTATVTASTWSHIVITWDGTTSAAGVKMYLNGTELTAFDTATDGVGTRVSDASQPLLIGNSYELNKAFDGHIDDVRLYNRITSATEATAMAAGNHPVATWTGATNTDYETASNWDTGAIPDPYARVDIPLLANQPKASAAIKLAGLTIENGARLDMSGYNFTMNDSGAFSNDGTLQLKNTETFTGFVNDTNSGRIMVRPDSDTTGLKTGSNYYDLTINDNTFAYWKLDEPSGATARDSSGWDRHATYASAPSPDSNTPATKFANDKSLAFDGTDDKLTFTNATIPNNATWCAWVKIIDGDAEILGSTTAGQYALAVTGGNSVTAQNVAHMPGVTWAISSMYGSWHNLCIAQTYTIAASLTLYIDGVSQGSGNMTNGVEMINTIGGGGDFYTHGNIDDVRIYSKALSGTEIGRIAAGNQPATTSTVTGLSANLDLNGSLDVSSGTLDSTGSNYSLHLGGNLYNDGGVYNARSNTVTLDGTDQLIASSGTFYTLSKAVSSAATLTFGRGSTNIVSNQLSLTGMSGQLLSLRSSTTGTQWNIDPQNGVTIDYLDLKDSNNINASAIDITDNHTTNSGNNTNWTINVAPDSPTSLGGTNYVNGSWVNNNIPTLTFNLTDTNLGDQLAYEIELSRTSDFSTLDVHYISAPGAQGARTFQVGQSEVGDNCITGCTNLADGDYYWRIKTIDDYAAPHESGYTVANSGAVAFKLDASGPTKPGTPTTNNTPTNKKPQWDWTGSTDAAIGLATPIYTLQWSKDSTFTTSISSTTTSNLTFTHSTNLSDGTWYFRVRADDLLGNHSAWSTSGTTLIDTTGPSTPITPNTASPTNFNFPTWGWPVPTDSGVGLAATPYTVQWSLLSNFTGGTTVTTTSGTNSYAHVAGLTDGTWYFRVKAADALGNSSAYSSAGTVLIDTSPPTNPGEPASDFDPTNDNTPNWTWDPSVDAGVGLAATPYTVQWSSIADFSMLGGNTTVSSATYTHGTDLTDGTWYFRVKSKDVLNNQSGYSDIGQVTVDTVAPDKPSTPTVSTPTNDTTPTWSWTEPNDTGAGYGPTPYTVEWSTHSDFSSITASDTTGSLNYTNGTALAEGTWYFRIKATDAAGNTSVYSDGASVYIDTTAPTVPSNVDITTPVPDNTPTWTWDASSDSGIGMNSSTPYEVQWSTHSDFSSNNFTATASSNTYTHTTTLADGTWYFRVRGVDNVGNRSSYSAYEQQTIDVNPPTTPGNPTTTTPSADNTPTWSWTASTDAGTGLDPTSPYTVEWSTSSTYSNNTFSDTSTTNSYTHTTALADGTWYVRIRAQDAVTNYSAYTANGTVVVDATAPITPGTPTTTTPTTDDTPTFTWAGATDSGVGLATTPYVVEWSTASDFSVSMQSSTSTTASFTFGSSLADGAWYIRVRAKDVVNNTSPNSANGTVYIDDTAPGIPGAPTTTTPTDNTTPTWNWSASTDNGIGLADPAYEVQWSLSSTFASGVSGDTVNTNSYTHGPDLADGTWYFRVRALDDLGNTSAYSSNGSVVVSTAGPTAPGTPATTTPTANNLPVWTWTASSSPAGLANPAYSLEWSQDNTFGTGVSAQTVNSTGYTHLTNLADGTWYMRVKAEDQTGLFSGYSATASVFIDTTAPSVAGTPSTTNPTADNTPTWSWTASSDASGVGLGSPAYSVEWSQDAGFGSGVNSATSASASFTNGTALTEGTWYLRVKAKDSLNNQSTFTANGTVVIDSSGPTTPGTPSTTSPTADNTPTWSWTASTDVGGTGLGTPAYSLQWSKDSTFGTGVSTGTASGTTFTHGTDLSDGTWYFRLRANDAVGNQSSYTGLGSVVVDTTAPSLPGTPTAGSGATNDTTPTWSWTASTDAGGTGLGTPAYSVQWSQDNTFGSGVSSATANGANYTHSVALAEGTWYFRARAKDAVNNQSSYTTFGTIVIDTDLPTAPGAPATSPSPTNDTTPTWTWTASSDIGTGLGTDPYTIQWSKDAGFSTGVTSATVTAATFTHTAALSDGTWYFHVKSTDGAGNDSSYSSAGTVVIDATGPTTPGTPSTTTPTKSPLPVWTWTASTDSGVGLDNPAYELQWSKDAGFASGVETDTVNTGGFTHTTPLADGFWHFRVRANDDLGNHSAWASAIVSVDNTPPVAANIGATANASGATITWTTDEAASSQVHYSIGGELDLETTETDTATRVTNHSVAITGINPCVTIQYQVSGEDVLANLGIGAVKTFTTAGCVGSSAVATQSATPISAGGGGSASLASGTANIALAIPSGFAGQSAEFQIKQLVTSTALGATGSPAGRTLVGNHLYDLKAASAPDTLISTFNNAVTVAMLYSPTEIAGFDQSTLAIFRWDGGGWQQLTDCGTNVVSRTTTCRTPGFSVFGLFGKATVPSVPLAVAPDPVIETPPDPEPVKTGVKTSTPSKTEVESATTKRSIGTAISDTIKSVAKKPSWIFGTLFFLSAVAILGFITYRKRQNGKPHYGIHKDE